MYKLEYVCGYVCDGAGMDMRGLGYVCTDVYILCVLYVLRVRFYVMLFCTPAKTKCLVY